MATTQIKCKLRLHKFVLLVSTAMQLQPAQVKYSPGAWVKTMSLATVMMPMSLSPILQIHECLKIKHACKLLVVRNIAWLSSKMTLMARCLCLTRRPMFNSKVLLKMIQNLQTTTMTKWRMPKQKTLFKWKQRIKLSLVVNLLFRNWLCRRVNPKLFHNRNNKVNPRKDLDKNSQMASKNHQSSSNKNYRANNLKLLIRN